MEPKKLFEINADETVSRPADFALTGGIPATGYVSSLFTSANTSTRYEMADVANDTLKVQTFNRLAVSDKTTHDLEFPDASTGRSRDFALRLEIEAGSYTPSVTFPSATYEGDDFPDITPDASNAKVFLICFTETKNLTWLVKAMELKTPTTPPPVATV